jgi:hypothetical protein
MRSGFCVCPFSSRFAGVGHDPVPLPALRRTDGASWNTVDPHLVARTCHFSENSGEAHVSDSRRILEKRPSGLVVSKQAQSLRPEPAVIFASAL